MAAEAGQGLLGAVTSYARGDMGGVFKSAMGLVKTAAGKTQKAEKLSRATKTSPADVVSIHRPLRRRSRRPELRLIIMSCRFLGVDAKILKPVLILRKPGRRLGQ